MSLTNMQYDEIMRGYQARQLANHELHTKRRQEAYNASPRLKEIDAEIASISVSQARKRLDGDLGAIEELKAQIAVLKAEKEAIFTSLPYPAGYFDPVYTCPDCKDTGYHDGHKCHCFTQQAMNLIYQQSNIHEILERENFKHFSLEYFSKEEVNPTTGLTSYDTMKQAYEHARFFIEDFKNKPKNLLFCGNTGVGKTFLSNCIAKELLDKGYSVIYFTAFQLFDILSKGVFDRTEDSLQAHRNIFECDLLIIDDLGTECSNSFTVAQVFLVINERILRNKSTIISTNLSLNQIMNTYSERTFSRITQNYSVVKLFGDDLRLKLRQKR